MSTTIITTPDWWFDAPIDPAGRHMFGKLTSDQRADARDAAYRLYVGNGPRTGLDDCWYAAMRTAVQL